MQHTMATNPQHHRSECSLWFKSWTWAVCFSPSVAETLNSTWLPKGEREHTAHTCLLNPGQHLLLWWLRWTTNVCCVWTRQDGECKHYRSFIEFCLFWECCKYSTVMETTLNNIFKRCTFFGLLEHLDCSVNYRPKVNLAFNKLLKINVLKKLALRLYYMHYRMKLKIFVFLIAEGCKEKPQLNEQKCMNNACIIW